MVALGGLDHTAYSTETFLDRLAAESKQDPVAMRLCCWPSIRAIRRCSGLAADKAGWGTPLAAGKPGERRGRGVAVHESFHSFVAQVAEVTVAADGSVKVDRIVSAVDCGMAINRTTCAPGGRSVGFALSAALHGEITLGRRGGAGQLWQRADPHQRDAEGGECISFSLPKPTGIGGPACRQWRRPY